MILLWGETEYFSYTAPLTAVNTIDATPVVTPTPEVINPPIDDGGFNMDDIMIYGVVALFFILVLILVFVLIYRARTANSYNQPNNSRASSKSRSYENRGGPGRRRH